MKLFENRNLLIVTKHGKEAVLQPVLESNLKVKCYLNTLLDTDTFGTFSGEIDRKDDALTTLKKKCLASMLFYNADLAVASEGSFGPHPSAFFASADDELVILIDVKNKLEIIGRKVSFETNFASLECSDLDSFMKFLKQVKFPSHKVILKTPAENDVEVHKDIATFEEAIAVFELLVKKFGKVYAETDMRAMNNPSRMYIIEQAAENLVEKITSLCPECKMPGFSVSSAIPGLQCSSCHLPTKSTLYHLILCSKCQYSEQNYFPSGASFEDPMYCDNCNP